MHVNLGKNGCIMKYWFPACILMMSQLKIRRVDLNWFPWYCLKCVLFREVVVIKCRTDVETGFNFCQLKRVLREQYCVSEWQNEVPVLTMKDVTVSRRKR